MKKKTAILCFLLALATGAAFSVPASGETEELSIEEIVENVLLDEDGREIPEEVSQTGGDSAAVSEAREDFIDRIIALGKDLYEKADGKRKRAHYASDIYVCKNYTVYLFRQNRDAFRMAAYPDTPLVIPNNLPAKECKPYAYGFLWENVSAEEGNPFEVGAQFIYDPDLSKEENLELAKDFMRQARKGDFFQMSANYEYGVGAHSAIIMGYDPLTDEIHWLDSNMRGGKNSEGIRYGVVQYDAVRSVEWWAGTFCHKKRGATLYRLRSDIVYAEAE
ncbi:MAG: hypothetical protein IKE24_04260 [Clostridia bacterium]|nr:hypothetical protein [Clostridia bacterium]